MELTVQHFWFWETAPADSLKECYYFLFHTRAQLVTVTDPICRSQIISNWCIDLSSQHTVLWWDGRILMVSFNKSELKYLRMVLNFVIDKGPIAYSFSGSYFCLGRIFNFFYLKKTHYSSILNSHKSHAWAGTAHHVSTWSLQVFCLPCLC